MENPKARGGFMAVSALLARGDHRQALELARQLAADLGRPPHDFVVAEKPAAAVVEAIHPGPKRGRGRFVPRYDSPKGRVLEALIAVADCPAEATAEDDRARWERLRHACEAWLERGGG